MIFIVLTGGLTVDCRTPPRTATLLDTVVKSFCSTDTLIITGKGTTTKKTGIEITEAKAALEYLLKLAIIPQQAILLEERALDTIGNVAFSFHLLKHKGLQNELRTWLCPHYQQNRLGFILKKIGWEKDIVVSKNAPEFSDIQIKSRVYYEKVQTNMLRTELDNVNSPRLLYEWLLQHDFAYNGSILQSITDETLLSTF